MARELADRRDRLFGREGDLRHLLGRARQKGLTAVVARPQMGKSWLLTELARRLDAGHDVGHLVGFAESAGQTPDLLLRAVVDLYSRWLADASHRQQARMAWAQQKGNVLPGVANAVAKMIKEAGQIAKPITGVVEDAINGLIAANQTLTTGGIQLPTLQYDQARDLVALTHRISANPVALVLDQWEQSPDPKFEAKTLHAFLHHLDEWPPCHVFLALRPDEPAHGEVEKLAQSLPGAAETYALAEMDLDREEGRRLTAFVRNNVPAAAEQSDENLLELVDGYPGVVYQWTGDYWRAHMANLADLGRVADDAQNYRFSDLKEVLPPLDGERRRLAIRVALLPLNSQAWPTLRKEWLGGLPEGVIDDLTLDEVLESRDPPSFGHAKRWQAAREWFFKHRPAYARAEVEKLIAGLATPVAGAAAAVELHAAALVCLLPTTLHLGACVISIALCQAASTMYGHFSAVDENLARGAREARTARFGAAVPLLALGLFNAVYHATRENSPKLRDALLGEMWALAEAHPEEPRARRRLAMGLSDTLVYTKREGDLQRRDAMLTNLRALATAHPEDAAVAEWLAKSLSNALNDARAEDDPERRDALLDELRELAKEHPQNTGVRDGLSKGLFHTLNGARAEEDLERRDALLDELRALAEAYADDETVRKWLARGLSDTQAFAKGENDLARREALLDELRALGAVHAEDAAVREGLATALVNTLIDAKAEDDLAWRDALLAELWALAGVHPEDAAVRARLAEGLFNTLNDAKAEDDLARRDALLAELRTLTQAHSEEAAVRENLAMGLAKTMLDAADEGTPEREAALRDELGALATGHAGDSWVEQFRSAGLL